MLIKKKTGRKNLSLGECGGRKDLRGTGERKVVGLNILHVKNI